MKVIILADYSPSLETFKKTFKLMKNSVLFVCQKKVKYQYVD